MSAPKNLRLDSTNYFIIKIPNKQGLPQIAINHSSDMGFKDFMNLQKTCTAKSYSFLAVDAILAWVNYSLFRKNLLQVI